MLQNFAKEISKLYIVKSHIALTYEEYIHEQQTAFAEEHSDECCFVENQAEGVFVRGH